MSTFLSLGEVLWDIFPNAEHMGGAPFNFVANCTRLGHKALLLSAVGKDELAARTLEGIRSAGVSTQFVQQTDKAPTGTVRVEFDAAGQPHYTIMRPAAYDFIQLDAPIADEIRAARPDFLCFGTLTQTSLNNLDVLLDLIDLLPKALRFYDINLRKDSYSFDLLRQLLPLAQIVKFNDEEMRVLQQLFGSRESTIEEFCRAYAERFKWRALCVTKGADGCALLLDGEYVEVPGFHVKAPSPVGAGDAFAAAFCHGVNEKWPAEKIGDFANRVGALVASRTEAVCPWTVDECYALGRTT